MYNLLNARTQGQPATLWLREALREAQHDEREGADIMMVKPALPYLDISDQDYMDSAGKLAVELALHMGL